MGVASNITTEIGETQRVFGRGLKGWVEERKKGGRKARLRLDFDGERGLGHGRHVNRDDSGDGEGLQCSSYDSARKRHVQGCHVFSCEWGKKKKKIVSTN